MSKLVCDMKSIISAKGRVAPGLGSSGKHMIQMTRSPENGEGRDNTQLRPLKSTGHVKTPWNVLAWSHRK